MSRISRLGVAALVASLLVGSPGWGQDALLQDLYGRGVHAFFSRQYDEAHELLTQAIDSGSRDPRCYYYRGMSYNRLGRPDEAQADFRAGAQMELASTEQFFNVSQSLQRVQGPERIQLEQIRSAARLANYQRGVKAKVQRYEDSQRAEQQVIRKPAATPADTTLPAPAASNPPTAAATDDLFSDEKPTPAPAKPAPAAPTAAKGDDPFGADMPAEKPAAKPAAEPEQDPFGGDAPAAKPAAKPAADDPFGAGDAPGDAPASKPAAKPAADDPFGADEAPAAKPAAKPAAEPSQDPLADDSPAPKPAAKPAAEPAENDPFADDAPAAKPAAKPAAAPAADDAPAPKPAPKPAEENDPFADEPADMKKEAAPAAPAAPKPAAPKPDEDDPFAN